MNRSEFGEAMEWMERHFNKPLKDNTWYWEDLKALPGEAFKQICKSQIRNHAPNPGQFPTIQGLLDDWYLWQKSHPDSVPQIEWHYCRYCEPISPGLIRVSIPSIGKTYIHMGITHRNSMVCCGHCKNWEHRNPTWLRLTVNDIRRRGWEVLTQEHDPDPEDDVYVKVPTPTIARTPGMRHIEASLPTEPDEDIPF